MSGPEARRRAVAASLAESPIIGVVRTGSRDEARRQARELAEGGLALIEITFTVPDAPGLVRELIAELGAERGAGSPPWIGMGTVTEPGRAEAAVEAGAEFLVSPNAAPEVAEVARRAGLFLVLGALTPTEIVAAHRMGADLVKVYPLPPVGGPAYLATVRQPLGDLPMLAAGGFDVAEIPAYRAAGASAFGIGAPLLTGGQGSAGVARALGLARGEERA